MPAAIASSTAYCISGLSTIGSISLGLALVTGKKRVPSPATGKMALVSLNISIRFLRTCSRSYCAPVSLCRAVLGILTYIKYAPVPALRRAGRSRSASLCDGGDPGAAHCPPGRRAACGPPQQTDPASRVPRAAFRRALQGFQALATDREQVLNSTPTSEHHLPYKGPLSGRQTFKQGERCAVERREAFGAASAECAREPIGHCDGEGTITPPAARKARKRCWRWASMRERIDQGVSIAQT